MSSESVFSSANLQKGGNRKTRNENDLSAFKKGKRHVYFGKRAYAKMKIYSENASMLSDSTRFSNNQGLRWNELYSCYTEESITLLINERKQTDETLTNCSCNHDSTCKSP